MFDAIAPRYDLLNRLLSLGIDQRWRRELVRCLELTANARVLDHATGTADLALLIARSAPGIRVLGLDPSIEMLRIARAKVAAAGLVERVELRRDDTAPAPPPKRMTEEMVRAERIAALRKRDPVLGAAIDALDLEVAD